MTKTLTVNGVKYTLTPEKTLLENLEAHGLNIEYHCRDGHCGACKCRIITGNVQYRTTPLAYLRNKEILPCSCTSEDDIHLQIP